MTNTKLTPHDERRIAVAAGCDPRTVRAYLARRPTHSTTGARIAEALRKLGIRATSPPGKATGEDRRNELEAAILACVRAHPGCGVTAVRKATGGNAERVTQAIHALAERGALRREDGPRNAARLFVVEREPVVAVHCHGGATRIERG